jgi:hypothetical protein
LSEAAHPIGRSRKTWIIGAIVVILAALYFSGRLDYALDNDGLNFQTCARNGFGATFCGADLTAYQNRISGVQQQIQQSQQSITQSECQSDPQLSFCP